MESLLWWLIKIVLGGDNYVDTLCDYVDTLYGLSQQVF